MSTFGQIQRTKKATRTPGIRSADETRKDTRHHWYQIASFNPGHPPLESITLVCAKWPIRHRNVPVAYFAPSGEHICSPAHIRYQVQAHRRIGSLVQVIRQYIAPKARHDLQNIRLPTFPRADLDFQRTRLMCLHANIGSARRASPAWPTCTEREQKTGEESPAMRALWARNLRIEDVCAVQVEDPGRVITYSRRDFYLTAGADLGRV